MPRQYLGRCVIADQHNANIPAVGNQILQDIPDIKENLEWQKDVMQNFVGLWDDSTATGIFPGYWGRAAYTTTQTLDNTDHYVECDASGGAWTLTLPSAAAATIGAGRYYIIKLTDATNALTIDCNGAETIDGITTATMAVANEILVLISDGTNWQVLQRTVPNSDLKVMPQRSKFAWKDADELYINGGCYHLQSVNQQFVYWNSQITFVAGSGGSNAGSTNLGANERHYVYIDDSAVATQASPLLDADCFLNSTTAPTYNHAKRGEYNGADKCIFGFLTDGANAIIEFFHDGGEYVSFADGLAGGQTAVTDYDFTDIDVDTTWDDVYLPIPAFSIKAEAHFEGTRPVAGTAASIAYWRTNGQTAATGHYLFNTATAASHAHSGSLASATVLSDATQIIEVKYSRSDAEQISVYINGFYLPTGM